MWKGNIRAPFLSCWCVGLFLFFVLRSFSVLVILKVPDWLPSSLCPRFLPRIGKIREAAELVMSGSSILAWPTLEECSLNYKGEDCSLWIQPICFHSWEDKSLLCQHQVTADVWDQVKPSHSFPLEKPECFSLSHLHLSQFHPWVGFQCHFLHKTFPEPLSHVISLPYLQSTSPMAFGTFFHVMVEGIESYNDCKRHWHRLIHVCISHRSRIWYWQSRDLGNFCWTEWKFQNLSFQPDLEGSALIFSLTSVWDFLPYPQG